MKRLAYTNEYGKWTLVMHEDGRVEVQKFCKGKCDTHHDVPQPTPQDAPPKGACGSTIYKWLGIRWYGIPAPMRHLSEFFGEFGWEERAFEGCGCIVRLKAFWLWLLSFRRVLTA